MLNLLAFPHWILDYISLSLYIFYIYIYTYINEPECLQFSDEYCYNTFASLFAIVEMFDYIYSLRNEINLCFWLIIVNMYIMINEQLPVNMFRRCTVTSYSFIKKEERYLEILKIIMHLYENACVLIVLCNKMYFNICLCRGCVLVRIYVYRDVQGGSV